MAQTRPTSEQLRFRSAYTGEHVLDTYLEAAERGGRSLQDLMSELFDTNGDFRSDNFQFRYDPVTNALQARLGQHLDQDGAWVEVVPLLEDAGTFSNATTYENLQLVTDSVDDVYIVHSLTAPQTFADEATFRSSDKTTKLVNVSKAREWAIKTGSTVDGSEYSAKYHAQAAASSATAASSSQSAAASSASAASTSEANALTYRNAAQTAQTAAETAQTGAETARTGSEAAQTAAETAQAAAEAAQLASENVFDSFDDRYLGAKASDPTLDNDGNALVPGALYWNTTDDNLRFWTGSIWQVYGAGTLAVQDANNVAITGGAIDGTAIGGTTPAAGTFTTLTGSGDVAIATDVLFVDTTNNRVGIRTANPAYELDVDGVARFSQASGNGTIRVVSSTTGTSAVYLGDTAANANGRIAYNNSLDLLQLFASNTAILNANSTGVGIGTTSPDEDLHVQSTGNPTILIKSTFTGGVSAMQFDNAGDNSIGRFLFSKAGVTAGGIKYDHATGGATQYMGFNVAGGADKMTLTGTGRLGLNTTSPGATLDVNGNARIGGVAASSVEVGLVSTGSNSYAAGIQVRNYDAAGWARMDLYHSSADQPTMVYQTSSGAMYFRNDATTSLPFRWNIGASSAMALNSLGHFGIGTTSPNTTLDVNGTAATNILRVRRNLPAHSTEYLDISVGDRRAHFHSVQDELAGTGGGFQFDLGGSTSISDAFLISQQSDFASGTPSNTLFAVLASGNVGIGAMVPEARVHTLGATASGGIFVDDSSFSSAAPAVRVLGRRQDGNTSSAFAGKIALEKHRSDAAVGTGQVLGSVIFGGNHTNGTEANIAYPASIVGISDGAFNSATDMPTGLAFFTGSVGQSSLDNPNTTFGVEAMRITSDRNVGMGEASPDTRLHVNSGTTNLVAKFESTDATATLALLDSTTTTTGNHPLVLSRTGNATGIWAGGSERISILDTGATGIGTTSPDAALHLVSTGSLPFIAQGASSTVRLSMGNTSAPLGKRFFGLGITSGSELTFQGLTDASTFARNLLGMSHDGGLTLYNASSGAAGAWDASNVRLGIGTTTPVAELDIVDDGGQPSARLAAYNASASGPSYDAYHARGSEGTPTATQSGDVLVALGGGGHDGTAHPTTRGKIQCLAEENWTGTAQGAYWRIQSTDIGATTRTTVAEFRHQYVDLAPGGSSRLRVLDTGEFGVGNTNPSYDLHIGNGTGGAQLALQSSDTGATIINMGDATNAAAGKITYQNSTNKFEFTAGGSIEAVLDGTGLGLGTTSPSEQLHVIGNARIHGSVLFDTFREIKQASSTAQGMGLIAGTSNTTGASVSLYGSTNSGQAGNLFLTSGGAASTGSIIFRNYDGSSFNTQATISNDGSATFEGDLTTKGLLATDKGFDLTISAGVITVTHSFHTVAAETGTTDTLDTINGGHDGAIILLMGSQVQEETITYGTTGNIHAPADATLGSGDTHMFIYDGTSSEWRQVS